MNQSRLFLSILFSLFLVYSNGQTKWLYYSSVEESFLVGDQSASINPVVISNAVNNSGIRLGAVLELNSKLSFESTLGVIGSAKLNGFTTKLVPVEILGHYEITTFGDFKNFPLKLNGTAGLGAALARAQSSTFNLSGTSGLAENFTVGAELNIAQVGANTLGIGYRHTFFTDDYLDANVTSGGIDQLSRWFAFGKIDLSSNHTQAAAEIAAKNYHINQLESQIKLLRENEVSQKPNVEKSNTVQVEEKTEPLHTSIESIANLNDLNPDRFDSYESPKTESSEVPLMSENHTQKELVKNAYAEMNTTPSTTDETIIVTENPIVESDSNTSLRHESNKFSKPSEKLSNTTERKYAIVVGSFDSLEDAEAFVKKVPGGKAFTTEVTALNKYRVIYGLFPSVNDEVLYRLEELRFYGFNPWITKI